MDRDASVCHPKTEKERLMRGFEKISFFKNFVPQIPEK
jgi:hypothetical protein